MRQLSGGTSVGAHQREPSSPKSSTTTAPPSSAISGESAPKSMCGPLQVGGGEQRGSSGAPPGGVGGAKTGAPAAMGAGASA